MIKALFKYLIVPISRIYLWAILPGTVLAIPLSLLGIMWGDYTHPAYRDQENSMVYFAVKGYFPGNELLACHTPDECERMENFELYGVGHAGMAKIEKCRGKWYLTEGGNKEFDACFDSVAVKRSTYCQVADPFCYIQNKGIIWNTKYDPQNPKVFVDKSIYTPEVALTNSEWVYMQDRKKLGRQAKFEGHELKMENIWVDIDTFRGIKID